MLQYVHRSLRESTRVKISFVMFYYDKRLYQTPTQLITNRIVINHAVIIRFC